jgi:hypothetical protein
MLVPQGYQLDLWRLDLTSMATATVYLLALGAAYTAIGFAVFSRRDM